MKRRCTDSAPAEKCLLDYEEYLRYYGMSCSMSGHEDYATAWELFGANQSGSGGAEGPVEEPAEALSAALSQASSGSPRLPHEDAEGTAAPEVPQALGVSLAAELETAAVGGCHASELESVADDESVAPTSTPASRDVGEELGEDAWAKVERVHKWELATARSAHEAHRAIIAAHWASAAQHDGAGEMPLHDTEPMDGDWTLA